MLITCVQRSSTEGNFEPGILLIKSINGENKTQRFSNTRSSQAIGAPKNQGILAWVRNPSGDSIWIKKKELPMLYYSVSTTFIKPSRL